MNTAVTAVTRDLPNGSAGFANPSCIPRAYTGFDVGPFFVHFATSDDELQSCANGAGNDCWHVMHRTSGFAAQKGIPTHSRAIWLAQKLMEFGSWEGDTQDAVRTGLSKDDLPAIQVLRADAVSGDCQGTRA